MSPADIDAPEFAAVTAARTEALLSQGTAFFETAHVRRDGTVIPAEISATMIELGGRKASCASPATSPSGAAPRRSGPRWRTSCARPRRWRG